MKPLTIEVAAATRVSGLVDSPPEPIACCVLAHGAGAGMTHAFMGAIAGGLAAREVATLRYQFPYMERGSRRPDPPNMAHAAVRAAVAEAVRHWPSTALFAGGKSFGGRMTSQAQASAPLPHVRGLVFLGFPLHAPGKPSTERANHLFDVKVPMLFLQGSRDELADLSLLAPILERLGPRATLHVLQDADHSFHVPARSARRDDDVRAEMLDVAVAWMRELS